MRNLLLSLLLLYPASLVAQTTQPADRAALEIRANEAFNSGNYASALPMLVRLAELSAGEPDALGPIQEKIRVCQRNIDNAPAVAATEPVNKTRKPHPAPTQGEVISLQIKDLGNFDYDPDKGGNIPPDVQALSGHKIRLTGFMIPMDQAANITQFALVPSLFACCFGQPPQVQHTIVVNCPKGKAVGYFPDEITVEGVLNVEEKKDEGFIVSIFEIQASSVKPSAK